MTTPGPFVTFPPRFVGAQDRGCNRGRSELDEQHSVHCGLLSDIVARLWAREHVSLAGPPISVSRRDSVAEHDQFQPRTSLGKFLAMFVAGLELVDPLAERAAFCLSHIAIFP